MVQTAGAWASSLQGWGLPSAQKILRAKPQIVGGVGDEDVLGGRAAMGLVFGCKERSGTQIYVSPKPVLSPYCNL